MSSCIEGRMGGERRTCLPPRGWDEATQCCLTFSTVTQVCFTVGRDVNATGTNQWSVVMARGGGAGTGGGCGVAPNWEVVEKTTTSVEGWAMSQELMDSADAPDILWRVVSIDDPTIAYYTMLGAGVSLTQGFEEKDEARLRILFWSLVGITVLLVTAAVLGCTVFTVHVCRNSAAARRNTTAGAKNVMSVSPISASPRAVNQRVKQYRRMSRSRFGSNSQPDLLSASPAGGLPAPQ